MRGCRVGVCGGSACWFTASVGWLAGWIRSTWVRADAGGMIPMAVEIVVIGGYG